MQPVHLYSNYTLQFYNFKFATKSRRRLSVNIASFSCRRIMPSTPLSRLQIHVNFHPHIQPAVTSLHPASSSSSLSAAGICLRITDRPPAQDLLARLRIKQTIHPSVSWSLPQHQSSCSSPLVFLLTSYARSHRCNCPLRISRSHPQTTSLVHKSPLSTSPVVAFYNNSHIQPTVVGLQSASSSHVSVCSTHRRIHQPSSACSGSTHAVEKSATHSRISRRSPHRVLNTNRLAHHPSSPL